MGIRWGFGGCGMGSRNSQSLTEYPTFQRGHLQSSSRPLQINSSVLSHLNVGGRFRALPLPRKDNFKPRRTQKNSPVHASPSNRETPHEHCKIRSCECKTHDFLKGLTFSIYSPNCSMLQLRR